MKLLTACCRMSTPEMVASEVVMSCAGYLMQLKPEYKYFTVYFMDKGLVFSNMAFPQWLDLLVFTTGATIKGVRTVPLPNLKKVSSSALGR